MSSPEALAPPTPLFPKSSLSPSPVKSAFQVDPERVHWSPSPRPRLRSHPPCLVHCSSHTVCCSDHIWSSARLVSCCPQRNLAETCSYCCRPLLETANGFPLAPGQSSASLPGSPSGNFPLQTLLRPPSASLSWAGQHGGDRHSPRCPGCLLSSVTFSCTPPFPFIQAT